jgi:hypothetical protein
MTEELASPSTYTCRCVETEKSTANVQAVTGGILFHAIPRPWPPGLGRLRWEYEWQTPYYPPTLADLLNVLMQSQ